jgi:hypothetical protein
MIFRNDFPESGINSQIENILSVLPYNQIVIKIHNIEEDDRKMVEK